MTGQSALGQEGGMDPIALGTDAFRDRTKMTDLVARDAKRFFRDRATSADLERWARDAVAGLWCDDVRVTTFIPTLALREISQRVAEVERDRAGAREAKAV